jgi:hypothetical protein
MNQPPSMAALPSVTVVMPCFNAESFIGDAIRSILEQRYPGRLEILVVDDGSTDGSVSVATQFDRVRVLRQANRGPAAARNLALETATGEVLAFLDADDLWTEGSLACRVERLMADEDVGVVFGNFTRWTPASSPHARDREVPDRLADAVLDAVSGGWLYPAILLDPIVHIVATVVRRSVFEAIGGFDTTLRTGEDYDFFIRAAVKFRFRRIDRIVAKYRQHATSITRVPQPGNNEYLVVSRAMNRFGTTGPTGSRLDQRLLERRLHRMCFDHALLHLRTGDAAIAAGGFRQALRHDPWRAKAWLLATLAAAKSTLPRSQHRPMGLS